MSSKESISSPVSFPFADNTKVDVRFSDIDSQGHANHTSTVEWIAHARVNLIEPMLKNHEGLDYVLVSLNMTFPDEVFWPGVVEIVGQVTKIGTKSVTTRYEAYQSNRLVATAECVNVFYDSVSEDKKTIKIPDTLRSLFEKNMSIHGE